MKAYWKDFSPIDNIGKTPPPAIVLLGTKDEYVPVETCKRFERLMEERGGRCDLHRRIQVASAIGKVGNGPGAV